MSVEVPLLQTRIDKLSAEIAQQREVLKQLELSKSVAQRQLNAIRDPIARLPLEISSEIFLRCLPLHPEPRASSPPMLLLNVCNAWTDIALSTPALWATIRLAFPGVAVLQTWLQRAHDYALSISLHKGLNDGVAAVLGQYATQVKELKIYDEELRVDFSTCTGFESFSRLESLTIGASRPSNDGDINSFGLPEILGLLRLAPNLVECTFHRVWTDFMPRNAETLLLLSLRCLKFGEFAKLRDLRYLGSDDVILRYLSLPALETLAFAFNGISSEDFLRFLKRSSPPLQTLILGDDSERLRFNQVEEWLRLIPSLAHLELYVHTTSFLDALLSALAESSSHLLPNLHTLKIWYDHVISESSYWTLLRALSNRRMQLVCVEVRLGTSLPAQPELEPDVRSGLQQLVAAGMDIRIGTDFQNFI